METIKINCSKPYNVYLGENIMDRLGELTGDKYSRILIVTDENVDRYYSEKCISALEGRDVLKYVIKPGEESKSTSEYIKLLNFLGENSFDRRSLLIALGGGVAGDLTGFAAATYMRGVGFAQIPTSLLAMVDSSVGGKTAIDLPSGKNLAGAFYQPDFVLCDVKALDTLPPHYLTDGMGEVIKYGIIWDEKLFEALKNPFENQRQQIISTCIRIKSQVVEIDEFDHGIRQILNFGHTPAHAVENLSGYKTTHGYAVAMGMALMTEIAVNRGICPESVLTEILNLLKKYGFNLEIPYTYGEIFDTIKHDKKKSGDKINLIFPEKIGKCGIYTVKMNEFKDMLNF